MSDRVSIEARCPCGDEFGARGSIEEVSELYGDWLELHSDCVGTLSDVDYYIYAIGDLDIDLSHLEKRIRSGRDGKESGQ